MGKIKWHPKHPYYKRVANVIDQHQHYIDGQNSESRKKLIEDILKALFLQPPEYSSVQPRDITEEEMS